MPIPEWKKPFYPEDWDTISFEVKSEQNFECRICGAKHGAPLNDSVAKVVLTTHHLLGLLHPAANKKEFLMALCQRCHLRLDAPRKIMNRKLMDEVMKSPFDYLSGGEVETEYGVLTVDPDSRLPYNHQLVVVDFYHIVGALKIYVEPA